MKKISADPKSSKPLLNRAVHAEPDLSDIQETDFRRGIRNPYLVLLAPDVWALFPTAEAVNAALRAYANEHGLNREPRPTHSEVVRRLMAEQRRPRTARRDAALGRARNVG